MEDFSEKLKSKNLKITPQRIAIYKFLCETDSHPTAEIIYSSLKKTYPAMSIATVYKTLAAFKKVRLIQELDLSDSGFRYDANINFHSHLICTDCKSIYDYALPYDIDININIENQADFYVDHAQLYFYGKCKNCRHCKKR